MRKRTWIWILVVWFFLVRISEYLSLEMDLGTGVQWSGTLRYTVIELGFWMAAVPVISYWAERFPLRRPRIAQNVAILCGLTALTVVVHSAYRVALNSLVYPNIAYESHWTLVRAYIISNSAVIAWFFWAVIGVQYAMESARASADRERELANAQLELLKGQLQPHFLFNTLNSISWLMRENVEAADNMVASLGELLRRTLATPASEEVTLREELQTLDLYLAIEKTRFQERMQVQVAADPEVLDARMPCLLLQPLVENAVRHGISRLDRPGHVEIQARREGNQLALSVLDDGPGLSSESKQREGIGLANTRARLEKHYGAMQSFAYRNRDAGGLRVEVRIPLRTGETPKHAIGEWEFETSNHHRG